MALNKYQVYQDNAVNTASGGQLTLMLYNGCIKFIRQSIKDINEQDFEAKNTHIQKAQDIVQELMLTLDPDVSLTDQLLPLYDYTNYQLQEANIKNDISYLEEALSMMMEFRNTWKEVLKQTAQGYTQGAQV